MDTDGFANPDLSSDAPLGHASIPTVNPEGIVYLSPGFEEPWAAITAQRPTPTGLCIFDCPLLIPDFGFQRFPLDISNLADYQSEIEKRKMIDGQEAGLEPEAGGRRPETGGWRQPTSHLLLVTGLPCASAT